VEPDEAFGGGSSSGFGPFGHHGFGPFHSGGGLGPFGEGFWHNK
jgi:hypothetical protein